MNDIDEELIENKLQEIREEIDNYEFGLYVTLCFIHMFLWDNNTNDIDENIKYYIGYKFKNEDGNDLTPDIGIDLNNDTAIIGELKRSFPMDRDLCIEELEDINKYDIQLFGWDDDYEKCMDEQDLVIITDQKVSRRIRNILEENKINYNNFSRRSSLIEYSKATGNKEAIFFRVEWGNAPLFNDIQDNLRTGIIVQLTYLIESKLIKIKFLDEKPPDIYLMGILWDLIFPSLIREEKWQESRNYSVQKHILIDTDVEEIQKLLIENYCHDKCHRLIKSNWIKQAMEKFVKLDLAEDLDNKKYQIKFRKLVNVKDKRDYFARRLLKKKLKKKQLPEDQLPLTKFF